MMATAIKKMLVWLGVIVVAGFGLIIVGIPVTIFFADATSTSQPVVYDPADLRREAVQRAVNMGEAGLIANIKSNMHDPDSFELVDDRAIEAGDHITMVMTYRGRNGFNALRTERVTATFDMQGNITSVQKIEE